MKPITVLLADDHAVLREGLRRLLENESDLEVVGEARDGRHAVALAERLHPAVVLMDLAMPRLNGLEATRQVLKSLPATKVLMLSAHLRPSYEKKAIEAGAVGFLFKQTSAHEVGQAIREVIQGKTFFSPLLSRRRGRFDPQSCLTAGAPGEGTVQLTSREREVLQLIAESKSNKETGFELGIGVKTVEKHRTNLMTKLGIHDTAGLTRYAISEGIIESSVQLTVIQPARS